MVSAEHSADDTTTPELERLALEVARRLEALVASLEGEAAAAAA